MTTVVRLKTEQMAQWNGFVENHPFGCIYHRSEWKEVIERSFKHIRGYFLGTLDSSGQITAGVPVYFVKSWLTGKRLVSIPFATFSDPLVSSPEQMVSFLKILDEMYNQWGLSYIELRTFRAPHLSRNSGFGMSCFHKHHYLPLDRSPEDIRKTFHKSSVQGGIKKAEKNNIEIRFGEGISDLNDFYRVFLSTRKRLGLPPIPYIFFKSLWKKFQPLDHLTLLIGSYQGQPIGGLLLSAYKETINVEFAGDIASFRVLCVNHLLYWEAIKFAYRGGYRIFSFGLTSPLNRGLMAFKSRWGTKVVDMPHFFLPSKYAQQEELKESSLKYRLIHEAAQRAPGHAYQLLGDFVYRHMG